MTTGPLVVGIGNPLRGDDGVGWAAADVVAADPRMRRARVVTVPGLTPELALEVHDASVVVVVDAGAPGPTPGAITVDEVRTTSEAHWPLRQSHALDAAALRSLAVDVYGRAAPMVTGTVASSRFDHGEGLSSEVAAAIPAVVDEVARIVERSDRRA